MATYTEQLAEINAAITAVLTKGQRYQIGDRMLWRADAEFMYSERARLEPLARAEAGGGMRIRRVVPL